MASGVTLLGHSNLLSPVRDTNGITLRWYWGMVVRPLSWPWRRNPWSDWRWVTLRFPATGPFVSIRWGRFVAYLGFKMFRTARWPDLGHTWMYPNDAECAFITPTGSLRGFRK